MAGCAVTAGAGAWGSPRRAASAYVVPFELFLLLLGCSGKQRSAVQVGAQRAGLKRAHLLGEQVAAA